MITTSPAPAHHRFPTSTTTTNTTITTTPTPVPSRLSPLPLVTRSVDSSVFHEINNEVVEEEGEREPGQGEINEAIGILQNRVGHLQNEVGQEMTRIHRYQEQQHYRHQQREHMDDDEDADADNDDNDEDDDGSAEAGSAILAVHQGRLSDLLSESVGVRREIRRLRGVSMHREMGRLMHVFTSVSTYQNQMISHLREVPFHTCHHACQYNYCHLSIHFQLNISI
jgi:hypothetical protein